MASHSTSQPSSVTPSSNSLISANHQSPIVVREPGCPSQMSAMIEPFSPDSTMTNLPLYGPTVKRASHDYPGFLTGAARVALTLSEIAGLPARPVTTPWDALLLIA